MPVDGRFLLRVLIISVMVMALGMLIRWAFSRGRRPARSVAPATASVPGGASPTAGVAPGVVPASDDYGLLAAAAVVTTEQDAKRIRDILGLAGIKATTTQDRAGRWRVLVFSSQLHRARRVAGGSSGSSSPSA